MDDLLAFRAVANALGWQMTTQDNAVLLNRPGQSDRIYGTATSHWLQFVKALLDSDRLMDHNAPDLRYTIAVLHYLLRLNDQIFLAKFQLDNAYNIVLAADAPKENVAPLFITRAAEAVAQYADAYARQISIEFGTQHAPVPDAPAPADVVINPRLHPGIRQDLITTWLRSLNPDGWYMADEAIGQTWPILHKKNYNSFPGTLTVSSSWFYFQLPLINITPIMRQPEAALKVLLLRYLLRLNDMLFMAKACLNAQGMIILALEFPTETVDFALFRLGTQAIAQCLEHYNQELQMMASLERNHELANLLQLTSR